MMTKEEMARIKAVKRARDNNPDANMLIIQFTKVSAYTGTFALLILATP